LSLKVVKQEAKVYFGLNKVFNSQKKEDFMKIKKLLAVTLAFMLMSSSASFAQWTGEVLNTADGAGGADIIGSKGSFIEAFTDGTSAQLVFGEGHAVIDWGKLNVGSKQVLEFLNEGRVVLNQVLGGDVSTFAGTVKAGSGRIIISNEAGIVFDGGKFISPGALTLTTNKVDFNLDDGKYSFKYSLIVPDSPEGKIEITNGSKILAGGNVELITRNGADFIAIEGKRGINIENSKIAVSEAAGEQILVIDADGQIRITSSRIEVDGGETSLLSKTGIEIDKTTVKGDLIAEIDVNAKIASIVSETTIGEEYPEKLQAIEDLIARIKDKKDAISDEISEILDGFDFSEYDENIERLKNIRNIELAIEEAKDMPKGTVDELMERADAITNAIALLGPEYHGKDEAYADSDEFKQMLSDKITALEELIDAGSSLASLISDLEIESEKLGGLISLAQEQSDSIKNSTIYVSNVSSSDGLVKITKTNIAGNLSISALNTELDKVKADNIDITVKDALMSSGQTLWGFESINFLSGDVVLDLPLAGMVSVSDIVSEFFGIEDILNSMTLITEEINSVSGSLYGDEAFTKKSGSLLFSNLKAADTFSVKASKIDIADNSLYVNNGISGNVSKLNNVTAASKKITVADSEIAGVLTLLGKKVNVTDTTSGSLNVIGKTRGTKKSSVIIDNAVTTSGNITVYADNITIDNTFAKKALLVAKNNLNINGSSLLLSLGYADNIFVDGSDISLSALIAKDSIFAEGSDISKSVLYAKNDIDVTGNINRSLAVANNIDVSGTINKSAVFAKNDVTSENVNQSLIVAGENITVENTVLGSALTAGSDIDAGSVYGSAVFAGNNARTGNIGWSLVLAKNNIYADGNIRNSFVAAGHNLITGDGAKISGSVLVALNKASFDNAKINDSKIIAKYAGFDRSIIDDSFVLAKAALFNNSTVSNSLLKVDNIALIDSEFDYSKIIYKRLYSDNSVINADTFVLHDAIVKNSQINTGGNIIVKSNNKIKNSALESFDGDVKILGKRNTIKDSSIKAAGEILVKGKKNNVSNSDFTARGDINLLGENNVYDTVSFVSDADIYVQGNSFMNISADAGNIYIDGGMFAGSALLAAVNNIEILNVLAENIRATAGNQITSSALNALGDLNFAAAIIEMLETAALNITAIASQSLNADTVSAEQELQFVSDLMTAENISAQNIEFVANDLNAVNVTAVENIIARSNTDYYENYTGIILDEITAQYIALIAFDDNHLYNVIADKIDFINALKILTLDNVNGDLFVYKQDFLPYENSLPERFYPARDTIFNVGSEKWNKEEEDEFIDHKPQIKQEVTFNLLEKSADVKGDYLIRALAEGAEVSSSDSLPNDRALYIFDAFKAN